MGAVTRSGARLSLVLVAVALGSTARAEGADPEEKSIVVSTFSIPTAYVGEPYEQHFDAIRGQHPYVWSIVEPVSTVPPGLSMSPDGLLSGTPTEAGRYGLAIRWEDQIGRVSVQPLTLIVEPARPFCERPENQDAEACLGGCDCRGAPAGDAGAALGLATAALLFLGLRRRRRGLPLAAVLGLAAATACSGEATSALDGTRDAGPGASDVRLDTGTTRDASIVTDGGSPDATDADAGPAPCPPLTGDTEEVLSIRRAVRVEPDFRVNSAPASTEAGLRASLEHLETGGRTDALFNPVLRTAYAVPGRHRVSVHAVDCDGTDLPCGRYAAEVEIPESGELRMDLPAVDLDVEVRFRSGLMPRLMDPGLQFLVSDPTAPSAQWLDRPSSFRPERFEVANAAPARRSLRLFVGSYRFLFPYVVGETVLADAEAIVGPYAVGRDRRVVVDYGPTTLSGHLSVRDARGAALLTEGTSVSASAERRRVTRGGTTLDALGYFEMQLVPGRYDLWLRTNTPDGAPARFPVAVDYNVPSVGSIRDFTIDLRPRDLQVSGAHGSGEQLVFRARGQTVVSTATTGPSVWLVPSRSYEIVWDGYCAIDGGSGCGRFIVESRRVEPDDDPIVVDIAPRVVSFDITIDGRALARPNRIRVIQSAETGDVGTYRADSSGAPLRVELPRTELDVYLDAGPGQQPEGSLWLGRLDPATTRLSRSIETIRYSGRVDLEDSPLPIAAGSRPPRPRLELTQGDIGQSVLVGDGARFEARIWAAPLDIHYDAEAFCFDPPPDVVPACGSQRIDRCR